MRVVSLAAVPAVLALLAPTALLQLVEVRIAVRRRGGGRVPIACLGAGRIGLRRGVRETGGHAVHVGGGKGTSRFGKDRRTSLLWWNQTSLASSTV